MQGLKSHVQVLYPELLHIYHKKATGGGEGVYVCVRELYPDFSQKKKKKNHSLNLEFLKGKSSSDFQNFFLCFLKQMKAPIKGMTAKGKKG